MKKILAFVFVVLTLVVSPAFTAADSTATVPLKITYYATGTVEGYSYISKMKVFVDGEEVGVSPEVDQQKPNTFTVKVPKGDHKLKCAMWAKTKEGVWEERLVANDYSFDWVYESSMTFKKKNKMKIEFSIKEMKSIRVK